MKNKNPKISVILSVYNAEATIELAIKSILAQTFRDFEFLILDDGSTDNTPNLIRKFKDPRIKIYKQKNAGIVRSLNKLIYLARADLLARQDADDVSHPERLQKQFKFMAQNPSYGIVGTQAFIFNNGFKTDRVLRHPTSNRDLQYALNFNNPFVHSSILMRKKAIISSGCYKGHKKNFFPEDYDLWVRVSSKYLVANLNEFLVDYHETKDSLSRRNFNKLNKHVISISAKRIRSVLTFSVNSKTITNFLNLMTLDLKSVTGLKYFTGLKIIKYLLIKLNPARYSLSSLVRYHKVYFLYFLYKNSRFFFLSRDDLTREKLINIPLSPKAMIKFFFWKN
jgi:glycosyltransferase involved in cell wall biosynthesis